MKQHAMKAFDRRTPTIWAQFILVAGALISMLACSDQSVYLIPSEIPELNRNSESKINVQIRPIYTSDFESKDREKYLFDFSSYFTAIEIHFQNGVSDLVQWSPEQTFLRDGEKKEYRAFNEEEAYHYYKSGDSDGNAIVLLDKPYDQQKEDIDNIKRFMIKPVSLPHGGEVSGLLLFKKILTKHCENLELTVGGILINQAGKSVKFTLRCPEN